MKTAEIRESFLKFFESKSHKRVSSSSLIPGDDPTLLFVNAGMVQFKDCFLGVDKRDYSRATTCQKSLRISGKHNDLENVGRTARHHTFFEMLGNFSFGDYFKTDAIKFAWEYLTDVLKLPKERLWITIYEEDDEAEKLWREHTDVLEGRILRCGKDDNFWAMGETGPCGPCTEIHYFLGDDVGNQSEEEFRKGDGTYIEIWNLVFMQFNRDISGSLTPLPKPSVDTGMGLERIAQVKQGVKANYDIDLFSDIISFTASKCSKSYDGASYIPVQTEQYLNDVAFRVVADHSRSAAFLIADGVMPSSDGRGYVLRRLIRRACKHGRVLGFNTPFLNEVASKVVDLMGEAYPELKTSKEKIQKIIFAEEGKFLETLDSGISMLDREVGQVKAKGGKIISGQFAFQLHDTYGFPLDLTADIVKDYDLSVDEVGFEQEMELQRSRSREARQSQKSQILNKSVKSFSTQFVGYNLLEVESKIVGIFNESGEVSVASSAAGESEIVVVTEETPFYAESGGQIGDTGRIAVNGGLLDVIDTQKLAGGTIAHICTLLEGEVSLGERARLKIDERRRGQISVNHSATHILHQALREILGDHVKQAGSRVSDSLLRFDFSHFQSITDSEMRDINHRINQLVRENNQVQIDVVEKEKALSMGAMALFGEKYGDQVRVVRIGGGSVELCGGTHVKASGEIGGLITLGETSISAGVRRIEVISSSAAVEKILTQSRTIQQFRDELKSSEEEIFDKFLKLKDRVDELSKVEKRLQQIDNQKVADSLLGNIKTSKQGYSVISAKINNFSKDQLTEITDILKSRLDSCIICLATVSDDKAQLVTAVSKDLTTKYNAGKIIKDISELLSARGGGKPDYAQAGGGDPKMIDAALKKFEEIAL